MSTNFDYYYGHEAEQFTFYRIPKALFTEPQFQGLSVEAKVLYGLMLDRVGLSVRSGWVDENDHVYIYFTVADVEEQLQCSHSKAIRLLKELDQGIGLIQRKRQGQGHPDKIYVMNFVSGQKSQNGNSGGTDTVENTEESTKSDSQKSENITRKSLKMGPLEVSKTAPIKNERNKNDLSDTESILPIPLRAGSENLPADGMDGRMVSYRDCYSYLLEKWGYIALTDSHSKSELDSVFALGADVLSSTLPTERMAQQDMPRQQVVDRLLSLDFTHIDYVLDSMKRKNAAAGDRQEVKPIGNMRNYLLTALYNAPTTIDAYYSALVARNEGKEVMPETIAIPRKPPNYQNYEGRILC